MSTGIVKWFSPQRGYGFIITDDEKDVFLHKGNLVDVHYTPEQGDDVEFTIEETEKGLSAMDVEKVRY